MSYSNAWVQQLKDHAWQRSYIALQGTTCVVEASHAKDHDGIAMLQFGIAKDE